ncbi:MAG: ribonuclease T2 [Rudaea sp.]
MKKLPMFVGVVAMVLLFTLSAAVARGHRDRETSRGEAGRFDYYVMSLSWSPSYCQTHPDEVEQCVHKGFGFVLHGLWPQYRNGSWPQHCGTDAEPGSATIDRTLAFMPSRHLIEHEWQTHGSCTGLSPREYFDLADRAFASVKIPPALQTPNAPPSLSAQEIVSAFAQANHGVDERMITIECHDGGELTEVRICLDRETLAPQACGGRVRNSCRSGALRIPALR